MSVFHLTASDYHVFAWNVPYPSVGISTALDGDTVIARMESAVFYQYVLARLRVAAVTVRTFVPYMHTSYRDVLAEKRMNHPERRAQQCDILYQNVFAHVQINQLRSQTVLHTKLTTIHIHTVFRHFLKTCSTSVPLTYGLCFRPSEPGGTAPFPPCLVASVTVYRTFTGDTDILRFVRIDKRLQIPAVETFPSRRNNWIQTRVESEQQGSTLFHDQVYIAFQRQSSRVPYSGRYHDTSAARFVAGSNGSVDSPLVDCSFILRVSAEFGNNECFVVERRLLDSLFDFFVLGIPCRRHRQ